MEMHRIFRMLKLSSIIIILSGLGVACSILIDLVVFANTMQERLIHGGLAVLLLGFSLTLLSTLIEEWNNG